MHKLSLGAWLVRATGPAVAVLAGSASNAYATAHTPSISGDWPIALVLVVAAVAALVLLVRGVLFLDERDAWLRRGGRESNDWTIRD